jgi:predicted ATPase/class 3 adenylate cyclase
MEPPVGTVGLLFTDIEGSTALAHALGGRFGEVLAAHHEVVGGAIAAHGGYVDGTEGDAFFALFADAREAVAAALAAQRALRRRSWATPDGRLRVRMGVHVGHVERRATGYVGLEIHRAARVAAAAHGGQLLLTEAARVMAGDVVATEPLGAHRLKDFPSPETLHCAVVDGEGAEAFPPLRTLELRPTNLPPDDRIFVGRVAELADVVSAFLEDGDRLVTLTGMGGSGKTRLALAAGTALLDAHPGGVWWVPLAAQTDAGGLLPAIAAAMRAQDDGSRSLVDVLAARIETRPTLAVLDNLEHLPAAAPVIGGVLAAVPGLRVLATSQVPLRLSAERVLPVPELDPAASRELFARVGARVRPGFRLTEASTQVADELCERLDHLPLAIELAAARLAVLTPEQLLERLGAPLKLLRGGARDLPERQRSLRATVEWTLGLLDPDARALFTRLGVFAGPVELADIEAVCEDDDLEVLDAVAGLIDVGLLRRREDGSGLVTFRLPEALRQFAAQELDAADGGWALRSAHARHVLDAVWDAGLVMGCTAAAFERAVRLEHETAQALAWAREHDRPAFDALAAAHANRILSLGRVREGGELLEEVLTRGDLAPRTRAMALLALGMLELTRGNLEGPATAGREAVALLDADDEMKAYAQMTVAYGCAHGGVGDWRAEQERALEISRASGSKLAEGVAMSFGAQYALHVGDLELAEACEAAGTQLLLRTGAKLAWYVDSGKGDIALVAGRYEEAAQAYLRSMTAAAARRDRLQVLIDLQCFAAAMAAAGHHDAGLEVAGAAEAEGAEIGCDVPSGYEAFAVMGEALAAARQALGPEAAPAAVARGRAVPSGGRIEQARRRFAEIARAQAHR